MTKDEVLKAIEEFSDEILCVEGELKCIASPYFEELAERIARVEGE